MTELFERHSSTSFTGQVSIDDKGRPFFMFRGQCHRCGGLGRSEAWRYTGSTCYRCGGNGKEQAKAVRLYTAAEKAKLDAIVEKKVAKKRAIAAIAQAKHDAEVEARRVEFQETYGDLLNWLAGLSLSEDDFLAKMLETGRRTAKWTEGQLAAILKCKAQLEERAAKAASSNHVGTVGERLRNIPVVVERVHEFTVSNPYVFINGHQASETKYLITLRTEDGNALLVRTDKHSPDTGSKALVTGTVKVHGDYKGEAQTTLARAVLHFSE